MKRFLIALLTAVLFCYSVPVSAAELSPGKLYAEAAVLIDAGTGQVLYGKNEHVKMEPASLTKIMTCLLAIEQGDPDAALAVSEDAVRDMEDSSTMDVTAGETLTLRELLYGLMLPSANDAANVIAEYLGGSGEGFARLMNQRAASLGLRDTTFENPHGLPAQGHLTTAWDLAQLTRTALSYPEFLEYAGTAEYDIPETQEHAAFGLSHTLFMLQPDSRYYDQRVIAGKTGWTPGAGTCLMAVARQEDVTLIAVVLKADAEDIRYVAYQDMKALLDYGFGHFRRGKVSVPAVSYYPVSFFDADGAVQRGNLSSEAGSFSPLIPDGCDAESIFLEMPQQEQLAGWAQEGLCARVTFRNAEGEIWPWAIAEIPVQLELYSIPESEEKNTSKQVRPAMAQVRQSSELPLVPAAICCLVLMLLLGWMWRRCRPGGRGMEKKKTENEGEDEK